MFGAIAGDIIGSVYEFTDEKPEYNFPLFHPASQNTDDTVLTITVKEKLWIAANSERHSNTPC